MTIKFQKLMTVQLTSLMLSFCLASGSVLAASDTESFDIAEFHKILDSIEKSNIPEHMKDQLFQDMKTTIIENVRNAKISEHKKNKLINDLQSTRRN